MYKINPLVTVHPKIRTPPFKGQIPLHRENHGKNLTRNFLNSRHSISGLSN